MLWRFFFFQAEDGIRDIGVTGVQTCALPISRSPSSRALSPGGQHNSGRPPGDKARELGERGIPIFPVALGEKKSPPDVAVVSVRGPNQIGRASCRERV